MALKNNFYEEIFKNERKWIEMIDRNLLNPIFCNFELKPFYVKKREEIKSEYEITGNHILEELIYIIDGIIEALDECQFTYENSRFVDIRKLLPLFVTSQMNNNTTKKDSKKTLEELRKKKEFLMNEIRSYKKEQKEAEDYLYDDFPEEHNKVA